MRIRFLIIVLIVFALQFAPLSAKAGVWDRARSIVNWWQDGSIGAASENSENDEDGEEDTNQSPSTSSAPGMCKVPQQPPVIICELGSGFLCLNTPELGVDEDFIIIEGTIDRQGSTPADVSIVVQHEYTKKTAYVDTSSPDSSDCWNSGLETSSFCLDEEGFYSARVPLNDYGPHTISVSATRFSGEPAVQSTRTSRVKAPSMDMSSVTFEPDVTANNIVEEPYLTVNVSLLGDCQHCDFIGASTGAVIVKVENVMQDDAGNTSIISCETNIEQGGQGKFVLGVPTGPDQNEITITACNAATGEVNCPAISGVTFQGPGGITGMNIIEPPPQPAYSSKDYPNIRFEFEIEGIEADACVNVTFNRLTPAQACPVSPGRYEVELYPQVGINVVTVDYENEGLSTSFPWVFGWGPVASPFAENGEIKDSLVSQGAIQIALPARTVTDLIAPLASNFLSSDELSGLIEKITSKLEDRTASVEPENEAEAEDQIEIPHCSGESSLEGFTFKLVGAPSIGSAKIQNITFEKDALNLSVSIDYLTLGIGLVKDEDEDGEPDQEIIPLNISLRKAVADLFLKVDGENDLVLLSSPHTDCDFKNPRYCDDAPAALIPQNMIGDATIFGGYVRCEPGEGASKKLKEFCEALNSLNAQTGLINEKVLDAINSVIYCSGSELLTRLAREGVSRGFEIDAGEVIGQFNLPMGMNLTGGINIDNQGVLVTGGLIAGEREVFSQMPSIMQIPSVGVITNNEGPYLNSVDTGGAQLRLSLAADAINHLLFTLMAVDVERGGETKGFLDFDISEPFFNRIGFDFVYKCDAFLENEERDGDTPSALCNLRPRVSELLGTPLSKYGYLPANHPLMIRVEGNKAIPPRIAVAHKSEIPVVMVDSQTAESYQEPLSDNLLDIQLGGITVSFYALEVDESVPVDDYGNLTPKLDENGDPIIHSMRPDDPDPLNGQIASFELTLLLAVEIGDVKTNAEDPSQFEVMVRLIADRSRLVISPVPGSSTTTIPPASLISSLREKLQYAINIYSAKENAIRIPIPKTMTFDSKDQEDLFSMFGLKEISFGKDGLGIGFGQKQDVITLDISVLIKQLLHRNGQEFEDNLPR